MENLKDTELEYAFDDLMESIRLFYQGRLSDSVNAINRHFLRSYGSIAFHNRLPQRSILSTPNLAWEYLIQWQLECNWTRELGLGIIFRDIWKVMPTRRVLLIIGLLPLARYSPLGPANMGYNDDYERETIHQLALGDLFDLIREGCESGVILKSEFHNSYDLVPTIDSEFFELLNRCQYSKVFAESIKSCIAEGFSDAASMSPNNFSAESARLICRSVMADLFLPPSEYEFLKDRLGTFVHKFPEKVPRVTWAMKRFSEDIYSDRLREFILTYSAGRFDIGDPKAWWQILLESIGAGEDLGL